MSRLRSLRPDRIEQSVIPILAGLVVGAVVGAGLTVASRYSLGTHAGIAPWLQSIADIAVVIAALFAGWAAFIARGSYWSQRTTAQRQLQLANEEAGRLVAANLSTRHHASINLLWKFIEKWESDDMLRWRAELADGLLRRHAGGGELIPASRYAFGEIANFIDFAGYCVRRELLTIDDARSQLSYYWQVYWSDCQDLLAPEAPDPAGDWEDAGWLMAELAKLEPGGVPLSLPEKDMLGFLKGERDVAKVERAVRDAALGRTEVPVPSPVHRVTAAIQRAWNRYTGKREDSRQGASGAR
jgi:hypothetical protein